MAVVGTYKGFTLEFFGFLTAVVFSEKKKGGGKFRHDFELRK